MRKIAVFDLDHTILSTDSFVEFIFFMIKRYPWKIILLPYLSVLLIIRIVGFIEFDYFKSKWLLFFKGISKEKIENLSKELAEYVINCRIKPEALIEIERLRRNGYLLVLATASFEFYVRHIFERLKFDHLFGTKAKVDAEGMIVPFIDGKNCKGPEKIRRITSVINKNEIDADGSISYSDCESDLHFLELTGTFYLITKKKWKVLKEYRNK